MVRCCVWFVLFLMVAATTTHGLALGSSGSSSSSNSGNSRSRIHTIQVCQNKDCCQRFTGRASNLVQTLRQITYNQKEVVNIESTGCLSHCDKGPNMRILVQHQEQHPTKRGTTTTTRSHTDDEIVQHGIQSAHAAAAVLELVSGTEEFKIHPTLLAAWKVMEQAHQGRHLQTKCVVYFMAIQRIYRSVPNIYLASFYRVADSIIFTISSLVLLEAYNKLSREESWSSVEL